MSCCNFLPAIPDDAPVVEESDNEDEDMPVESEKRISSKPGCYSRDYLNSFTTIDILFPTENMIFDKLTLLK